jgi:hypothetical protein
LSPGEPPELACIELLSSVERSGFCSDTCEGNLKREGGGLQYVASPRNHGPFPLKADRALLIWALQNEDPRA